MISICIPAYKSESLVIRLLDSIRDQTFRDFEVIVTDDSPDDSVKIACEKYMDAFPLHYYKNVVPLGSPANWNFAISKAKGEWIKMMHHDDWFSQSDSLLQFHEASLLKRDFIFSAFTEVEGENRKLHVMKPLEERLLKKSPYNLFKKNFIGHPSTTLIKNNQTLLYDNNLKWVVDFEFYIRSLNKAPAFLYLKDSLIHIGISDSQITKTAFRNSTIEIPENIYLLNKIGTHHLRNVFVCDYYWRLCRNMSIRSVSDLEVHVPLNTIPAALKEMVNFQTRFPLKILQIGAVSKFLMFTFFITRKFD